jgi:hypothetical protein
MPPSSASLLVVGPETESSGKSQGLSLSACTYTFPGTSDVDFDLENDGNHGLHGLESSNVFNPPQVRRVTDIFDNPAFYTGTPESAEIIEGEAMNCHLVSALSNITSMDHLIKSVCVVVCP